MPMRPGMIMGHIYRVCMHAFSEVIKRQHMRAHLSAPGNRWSVYAGSETVKGYSLADTGRTTA